MKIEKKITIALSTAAIALSMSGCGSSEATNAEALQETQSGYFIDAAVAGAHYKTSSGIEGDTDAYGKFRYKEGDTVTFSLGKIILGEATPKTDGEVTPQTLVVGDETVPDENQSTAITLMLQMLQSLDSDKNVSNGITIDQKVIQALSKLDKEVHFKKDVNETFLIELDNKHDLGLDEDFDGHLDVNATAAQEHFRHSEDEFKKGFRPDKHTKDVNGKKEELDKKPLKDDTKEERHGQEEGKVVVDVKNEQPKNKPTLDDNEKHEKKNENGHVDLDKYKMKSTLTPELKDAIVYMGSEERLAYDLYMNLYNYHKENSGIKINQLYNIAKKSESRHIGIVQNLAKKYDLNASGFTQADTTVAHDDNESDINVSSGVYDIQQIQQMYDSLYAMGKNSQEDALKVGCSVEVTDIDDLDKYIKQAEDANASDVAAVFKELRNGSYTHYWAFDKALKNLGVKNGCYYEGDDLLTNKEDVYPRNEHGWKIR